MAVPVELGIEQEGWVEVHGQVAADERVVTTGQSRLSDATPIVIRASHVATEATGEPDKPRAAQAASDERVSNANQLCPPRARGISAMSISDICIRRPVFAWVLVSAPGVMGIMSYYRLGVDLFPNVDFPVCTVTTTLPGASAEEIETNVTKQIEDAVNTVSGVDKIQSTSSEGISVVIVQFLLSKNGDVGTQEVRDKVGAIVAQMPDGAETPVVDRFETDAMPVLSIAVSGRRDLREVTELARKQIKEQLETVEGVGAANLLGGRTRAMNVLVDTDQLVAFGLSIDDVRLSLQRQNIEVPGGRIDQGPRELVLRTLGRLNTADEFNQLIVANRGGYPIRIKDIGHAVDSYEEPRSLARLDGQSAVSVDVQKQSGTNVVQVTDAVKKKLARIQATLPTDIKLELIRDQSRFVKKSIEEVKFHLLLAAVLVSLTILLFIRDWRTTLIATLAIPTSIVPTFAFMYYMGFTLNNITMLGLILAIGIVIDDAVVVHENIFRLMEEQGLDGMTAARRGTREIALPVLATSLSLVVIFMPLAFMGGVVGRFFSSFGMTVACAILLSLFVSFTLTPMLCSRFLVLEPNKPGHGGSKSGFIYRHIDSMYGGPVALQPALQALGGLAHDSRHHRDRADRQDDGRVTHSARRPKRIRNQHHHARGLYPRADRQRAGRNRGAAVEIAQHGACVHDHWQQPAQCQGRGERHQGDDLRADGRARGSRIHAICRATAGP